MSIYLDYNATAPARPEVIAAVARALAELPGNPSSVHGPGRAARTAVEEARRAVAELVGASADEIVFTSGGTEGNHLAIRGLARAAAAARHGRRAHVLSSPLEHPSVRAALAALAPDIDVSFVAVGPCGEITPEAVAAALRPETVLVTLAAANHELGNAYDVAALAAVARGHGALFHADAVQAAGKLPLDVRAAGVDALTLSAHKLGGPKGVGAVYIRRGVEVAPLLGGGHQELGRRAGTENVPAIAGFAVAARLAGDELPAAAARIAALRAELEARLLALPGARLFGDREHRVPGTLSVGLGVPGHLLAAALDLEGVSVSTGAACASGSLEPSPVLLALGLPPGTAAEALRLSLGPATTRDEIDRAATLVAEICERLRRGHAPRATSGGRERVLVAMSGGVDSSTAAALLVEQGFDVVGATLKLYDDTGTDTGTGAPADGHGRCCTPADVRDARTTAAALGFPHYVLDERAAFSSWVIDDFVAAHRAGRTPNPCVRCNERLKFGPLLAFADAIGASVLATGHYARLVAASDGASGPVLARAADRDKDQSYFLFGVRPELLARVRFPLGDMSKDAVRQQARRLGLPNADKPDSQQICFIPDGDHKAFVEARGGAGVPGAIVDDASGAVLGSHEGTHRFTVGQRRGLPGGPGGRRFVLRVDTSNGEVRVGPRDSLAQTSLRVSDVRWRAIPVGRLRCRVQIRHHTPAADAWLDLAPDGSAEIHLDHPAMGVAPGQAAVFYDADDRVLGGGWITA